MEETWKSVVGYEGLYEVSNLGNVRSVDRYVHSEYRSHTVKGISIKQHLGKDGYMFVTLSKDGNKKSYKVHRLVAQAYIPNPEDLPQVNHMDEDKCNNVVTNLEWCTAKYNVNYGTGRERLYKTKLSKGIITGLTRKEWNEQYYLKNRDHLITKHKEYQNLNKEKHRLYMQEYRKRKGESI